MSSISYILKAELTIVFYFSAEKLLQIQSLKNGFNEYINWGVCI